MSLHIQSTLAEDQMSTSSCITTMQSSPPMRIYTDRDSLSGVDLNDEACKPHGLPESFIQRPAA